MGDGGRVSERNFEEISNQIASRVQEYSPVQLA